MFQLARDIAPKKANEPKNLKPAATVFPLRGDATLKQFRYSRTRGIRSVSLLSGPCSARIASQWTGSVKKAVPEEDQKKIDAVIAAIKPVIDKANEDKTISGRVAEAIRRWSSPSTRRRDPANPR